MLTGKIDEGKLREISLGASALSPTQEVMIQALVNNVNLGLLYGLNPTVIAEKSLRAEGHPIVEELYSFLLEHGGANGSTLKNPGNGHSESKLDEIGARHQKQIVTENQEGTFSGSDTGEKMKCSSCGAAQLRQNGTCMLCEVCGETSGCS